MELWELPNVFLKLEEMIAAGDDTTQLVNALVELGPPAIDEYVLQVEEKEAYALVAREKAKVFVERARSLEERAEKMRDFLKDIVNNHFSGKVRTGLGTYYVGKTTTYDYEVDFRTHPEFFVIPEPKIRKAELNTLVKANTLPEDIKFTTTVSESLRVRR